MNKPSNEKRQAFLELLAQGHSAQYSASSCGLTRQQAFAWKARDPDFAEEWERAFEIGTDMFEDRLRDLAINTGHVPALTLILKARRPERWASRYLLAKEPPKQAPTSRPTLSDKEMRSLATLPDFRVERVDDEKDEVSDAKRDKIVLALHK